MDWEEGTVLEPVALLILWIESRTQAASRTLSTNDLC